MRTLLIVSVLLLGCGDPPAPPRPVAKPSPRKKSPPSPPVVVQEPVDSPVDIPPTLPEPPASTSPFRPPLLPDDARPRPDLEALALKGIRCYESKHIRLFTDLPEDLAATFPPLVDRLHESLEAYFGPLPSLPDGGTFQVNGYLMRDRTRFDAAQLVPFDLSQIQHGRHRGYEFWMNDQTSDYYRRHLLFHEYTHCFMTITPHALRSRPWYIEGMAERFATHQFDESGRIRFDVFPDTPVGFEGWGRIQLVREAIRAGEPRTAPAVFAMVGADFATDNRLYAWSWAMCRFLEDHPLAQKQFRTVSQVVDPNDPDRSFLRLFRDAEAEIAQDWWLFAHHLCDGFDVERAATTFTPSLNIRANRGWQSTGLRVEPGKTYHLSAAGRCVLATTTKPWTSEPDGISIRYNEGRPIGRLLATIRPDPAPGQPPPVNMLDELSLGSSAEFAAPRSGTLYLRINDFWNDLANNTGHYTVSVTPLP
jgi:hypothetical protein